MNPSFKDQLKAWQHKHPEPTPKKMKPAQQPKEEIQQFSDSDIKYLMGTGRPTYRRHKGALRQK